MFSEYTPVAARNQRTRTPRASHAYTCCQLCSLNSDSVAGHASLFHRVLRKWSTSIKNAPRDTMRSSILRDSLDFPSTVGDARILRPRTPTSVYKRATESTGNVGDGTDVQHVNNCDAQISLTTVCWQNSQRGVRAHR